MTKANVLATLLVHVHVILLAAQVGLSSLHKKTRQVQECGYLDSEQKKLR
jgi:hypothetical protein